MCVCVRLYLISFSVDLNKLPIELIVFIQSERNDPHRQDEVFSSCKT